MGQAGVYGGVLALPEGGGRDGRGAGEKERHGDGGAMKAMPTDDDCFGAGRIREDGRALHPCYLFEVKSPAESKGAVGLLQAARDVAGRPAFRPLHDGACPLVKA